MPLASFARRFVAFALDSIVTGVTTMLLTAHLRGPAVGAVDFVLSGVYWTYFLGASGQTPAMRLLGLRVIPADDRPRVTYLDAAVRFFLMVVGEMAFFLGFVWAAGHRRRQAWHDLAARTLVVRTRRPVRATHG